MDDSCESSPLLYGGLHGGLLPFDGMPNGAEGREDIQKILNPEKTECTNESAGVLDIFPAHWQMREVLTEKESINRHTLP